MKCGGKGEEGESERKTREDNQVSACVGEGVFFRRLFFPHAVLILLHYLPGSLSHSTGARGLAVNRATVAILV